MPDSNYLQDHLNDPDLRYVAVTSEQVASAQAQIEGCEKCDPDAEIPFDWIIREAVTEKGYVDYILPAPGLCPNCKAEVHEKTLVVPIGRPDAANWI